jgi:hypothetical protein
MVCFLQGCERISTCFAIHWRQSDALLFVEREEAIMLLAISSGNSLLKIKLCHVLLNLFIIILSFPRSVNTAAIGMQKNTNGKIKRLYWLLIMHRMASIISSFHCVHIFERKLHSIPSFCCSNVVPISLFLMPSHTFH